MVFHPQTDSATKWANRSIGQVLQAIVRNDQKNWRQQCPLAEFALNSNISSTTGYAPFELNCGFMPQLGQRLSTNTKFAGVRQFAQQAQWNLMMAHDTIIESRVVQSHHANHMLKCTTRAYMRTSRDSEVTWCTYTASRIVN